MKKTIKLIVVALFAALTVLPLGGAEDPVLIPVIKLPETPDQNLGRGQVQLFVAEYDDLLNYVILCCTESCGNVTVTLTSTAGDWYQTVFDTSDGILYIPVSGDSGYYSLCITTSDGDHFFGEFIQESGRQ